MRGLIGVDIGGSGIKVGVVDSRRGMLIGDRVRVDGGRGIVEILR